MRSLEDIPGDIFEEGGIRVERRFNKPLINCIQAEERVLDAPNPKEQMLHIYAAD